MTDVAGFNASLSGIEFDGIWVVPDSWEAYAGIMSPNGDCRYMVAFLGGFELGVDSSEWVDEILEHPHVRAVWVESARVEVVRTLGPEPEPLRLKVPVFDPSDYEDPELAPQIRFGGRELWVFTVEWGVNPIDRA